MLRLRHFAGRPKLNANPEVDRAGRTITIAQIHWARSEACASTRYFAFLIADQLVSGIFSCNLRLVDCSAFK